MSTREGTSPLVRWKNTATLTKGPRFKPHETTNKDDPDRPVAYKNQGVGGTLTIRAYLTQNRNWTWNSNTLQMYTYQTGGYPHRHAPTCIILTCSIRRIFIFFASFCFCKQATGFEPMLWAPPAGTVTIGSRGG